MRIAIPVSDGKLSAHFGHCEAFALLEVDKESGTITGQTMAPSPPHQPGMLPGWLAEQAWGNAPRRSSSRRGSTS